jgi:mannose-6-phosphate isomerase-like protein (cupin superfamily)
MKKGNITQRGRALLILAFTSTLLSAQAPAPYSQLDPAPYDPAKDVDMTLFLSHWQNSPPREEHGSLVVRDIFTRQEGDLLRPVRPGAVLTQFSEFARAFLYPNSSTTPQALRDQQKIFYVEAGRGTVSAGGQTAELHAGVAVFIPARLEFSLANTGDETLEMYVVAEPTPAGFEPRPDMLVRDERQIPIDSTSSHWVNITRRLFSQKDGFAVLRGMAVVFLDPCTMAQPHASRPLGTDVLWIAVRGDIHTLLGKRLFQLKPGSAFKNPGDGMTYHANVNTSEEQIKLIWTRAVSYKGN